MKCLLSWLCFPHTILGQVSFRCLRSPVNRGGSQPSIKSTLVYKLWAQQQHAPFLLLLRATKRQFVRLTLSVTMCPRSFDRLPNPRPTYTYTRTVHRSHLWLLSSYTQSHRVRYPRSDIYRERTTSPSFIPLHLLLQSWQSRCCVVGALSCPLAHKTKPQNENNMF